MEARLHRRAVNFAKFATSPWTQNLYSYVGNNPVNYIDPTGHSATAIGLVAGFVIGGAFGAIAAAISGDDIGKGFVSGAITGTIIGGVLGVTIDTLGTATTPATMLAATVLASGAGGIAGGYAGEVYSQYYDLNKMGATSYSDYMNNFDFERMNQKAIRTGTYSATAALLWETGSISLKWLSEWGAAMAGTAALAEIGKAELYGYVAESFARELIVGTGAAIYDLTCPLPEPSYITNPPSFDDMRRSHFDATPDRNSIYRNTHFSPFNPFNPILGGNGGAADEHKITH